MARFEFVRSDLKAIQKEDMFHTAFMNNGSSSMAVDGSVTPVTFSLEELPDGQRLILKSITFLVGASEIIGLAKFGDITITSPVVFKIGDREIEILNNADIYLFSSDAQSDIAGQGSNTISVLTGHVNFSVKLSHGIIVNKEDVSITINDDVLDINYLRVSASGILLEG